MRLAAAVTYPAPYAKPAHTFRTAAGDHPAAGGDLGTVSFGDDFALCPPRNRFVLEHRTEHRPAGIVDGLRHPRLCQPFRTHVCDVDLPVVLHDPVRHHVEEMPAPVGNLCGQRPGANFLTALLNHAELLAFLPVEP